MNTSALHNQRHSRAPRRVSCFSPPFARCVSFISESCKAFVFSTPPSLVEPAAIHFLVECAYSPGLERWGAGRTFGENADAHALEVVKRGALIPANPKVYTEDQAGFELCVKRFRPLLVSIQNSRVTFSARLLAALVNFVLSEEAAEECQGEKGDGGERDATGRSLVLPNSDEYTFSRAPTQSSALPEQRLEREAGKARKLFFAVRWIEYLLSRDYVSQFHQRAAIFKKNGPNLRQKAQGKWRSDESAFMKKPIYLKEMEYPLNSITDKLEAVGESELGPLGTQLLNLFLVTVAESRQRVLKRKDFQHEGQHGASSQTQTLLPPPEEDQRKLTLEEMEAIFSSDSEPDEKCATAIDARHDYKPVKWVKISHYESVHCSI